MAFDRKVILQGNADKQKLEENPTVGFTASGIASPEPTNTLGQDPLRVAGPGGAFALKLMQDAEFAKNIQGWNRLFAESVPGAEFYQIENQRGAMG